MSKSLSERIRDVSNSYGFQQYLKANPDLNKSSGTDRDALALKYLNVIEKYPEFSSPAYARAVTDGYNPDAALVPYQEPPNTPVSAALTIGISYNFVLYPNSGDAEKFDVYAPSWDTFAFSIDASSITSSPPLSISVNAPGNVALYVANLGTSFLDDNVSSYSLASTFPGGSNQFVQLSQIDVLYRSGQVYLMLRNLGSSSVIGASILPYFVYPNY